MTPFAGIVLTGSPFGLMTVAIIASAPLIPIF